MTVKNRHFLFGVIILFIAGIVVKLLGLVNYIVLINIEEFGDRGIGIYSAGFTIYLVLLAISTMGFPAAISKMVAENIAVGQNYEAHKIFKTTFAFLAIVGAVFTTLLIGSSKFVAEFIKMPKTAYSVIALAPTIFFAAIMSSFRGYFQGMQDMVPQAVSQIIEQIFKLIFSITFVILLLPKGIEWSAAGATFGTTAGAVCGTIYLFTLYRRRKKDILESIEESKPSDTDEKQKNTYIIKNLLKLAIPISLGSIILTISSFIDLATVVNRLLYAGFSGDVAEKMYGQLAGKCQQLVNFPVALNMAIATAIIPAIAGSMALGALKSVESKISSALRLTMAIGISCSVGMSVLSEPILNIIYPNQSEGAHILQVLAYSIIFMAMSQTLAGILQGLGKVKVTALSLLAGAAVKLTVNFILVPIHKINIVGAAYGSIACYMVSAAINYIALRKTFRFKINVLNTYIKPLIAAAVMGITAIFEYKYLYRYVGNLKIATLFTVLISIAVFAVMFILSRAVSHEDLAAIPFGDKLGSALVKLKLLK